MYRKKVITINVHNIFDALTVDLCGNKDVYMYLLPFRNKQLHHQAKRQTFHSGKRNKKSVIGFIKKLSNLLKIILRVFNLMFGLNISARNS